MATYRRAAVVMVLLCSISTGACSAGGSPPAASTGTGASAPTDAVAQAAKAEGQVNTYGMPDTWANYGAMFAALQQTYGLTRSDIDMGSSVVLSRMTEEKAGKNDLADVLPTFAQQLADAGLTSTEKVSCWDSLPTGEKGVAPTGSVWNTAYYGSIGWLVNTSLVQKVPKTWADLADPALKNMISYPDPRASGTGITIVEAASAAAGGDPFNYQAGVDLLANLKRVGNIATIETKVDVSKYQRGEVGILINFDYNLLQWKKTLGIPSEVVIPSDGSVSTGVTVVAARNAPHPNAAKLALDFIVCGPGQALYAGAFVSPILSSVQLPADVAAQFPPKDAYSKVVRMDYAKAAAVSKAVTDAWASAAGG